MALFFRPLKFLRFNWFWVSWVCLVSCQAVQEEDLAGYWDFDYHHDGLPTEIFRYWYLDGTTAYIKTQDGMLFKGTFQIENREIRIRAGINSRFNLPFQELEADTLRINDSLNLFREPEMASLDLTTYDLLNINTTDTLSADRGKRHFIWDYALKYYKDSQQNLVLRVNDIQLNFKELPLFFTRKRKNAELLLFVDEKISLPELDRLHKHLALIYWDKLTLVSKIKDFRPWEIFSYRLFPWETNVQAFRTGKYPPPPPPPENYQYREEFLSDGGMLLSINNVSDSSRITLIEPNEKYLVAFSSELPVRDYFKIKMKLYRHAKAKQIQFRTEIYYPDGEPDIFDPRNAPLGNKEQ
ncbi:hypothetical protein [Flavilitoribacter nigricans]|uniref:Uncharacterized protein n=1 Tax=Flavilitoribacter nigricans (strain ATCC 23147 / DSM 23189 / NBRC 102662 / NCIMB 1420 / SS-2) TaxID=1122177 RepID=A0A2D0NIM4_FLAN2|nr:hypothetical protein [Flavilitoribacter nigricans]PHN08297.1 hypothetical protein CRP01_02955 [Flavilitoribacter nigricans DSM 23189 = NBRC 102662]